MIANLYEIDSHQAVALSKNKLLVVSPQGKVIKTRQLVRPTMQLVHSELVSDDQSLLLYKGVHSRKKEPFYAVVVADLSKIRARKFIPLPKSIKYLPRLASIAPNYFAGLARIERPEGLIDGLVIFDADFHIIQVLPLSNLESFVPSKSWQFFGLKKLNTSMLVAFDAKLKQSTLLYLDLTKLKRPRHSVLMSMPFSGNVESLVELPEGYACLVHDNESSEGYGDQRLLFFDRGLTLSKDILLEGSGRYGTGLTITPDKTLLVTASSLRGKGYVSEFSFAGEMIDQFIFALLPSFSPVTAGLKTTNGYLLATELAYSKKHQSKGKRGVGFVTVYGPPFAG